jgi:hypothetical protein
MRLKQTNASELCPELTWTLLHGGVIQRLLTQISGISVRDVKTGPNFPWLGWRSCDEEDVG